jgi:hypothetical protein
MKLFFRSLKTPSTKYELGDIYHFTALFVESMANYYDKE